MRTFTYSWARKLSVFKICEHVKQSRRRKFVFFVSALAILGFHSFYHEFYTKEAEHSDFLPTPGAVAESSPKTEPLFYYAPKSTPLHEKGLDDLLLSDSLSDCNSSVEEAFVYPKTQKLCDKVLLSKNKLSTDKIFKYPTKNFNRTLLIVSIFKPDHFNSIYKTYRLYHGIFYRIIFCITGMGQFRTFENGRLAHLENVSFVEFHPKVTIFSGALLYNCIPTLLDSISEVRKMIDKKVLDGILHISDDLILNMWRFTNEDHPPDFNWHLVPILRIYDVDHLTRCRGASDNNSLDCRVTENWSPLKMCGKGLVEAMNELEVELPWFIENLAKSTKGKRRVFNIYADLFYIAHDYVLNASKIFRIFAKHQVYMELAVGTVINGLTEPSVNSMKQFNKTGQQYGPIRLAPVQETYDASDLFYHPFKMGKIEFDTIDKQCLYCQLVKTFDLLRSISASF